MLGKGFHAKAGEPHAEPTAIADALAQVGGSMLRVLGPIRTRLNFGPPPWSLVDCHWHYGKLSISCQKPFIVDFPFLACLPTATLPSLGSGAEAAHGGPKAPPVRPIAFSDAWKEVGACSQGATAEDLQGSTFYVARGQSMCS